MNPDPELERWRSVWQVDVHVPPGLRERAQRQLRFFRRLVIGEVAVTVLMSGGTTLWALHSDQPDAKLLAIWIWAALLIAWLFRFFNDRGNWTGAAPDTEAFLHLWSRRLRARLRDVKFGCILYLVQLVFCCAWVYRDRNRHSPIGAWALFGSPFFVVVWIGTLFFFEWALRYSRRTRGELTYAERVSRGEEDETCGLNAEHEPQRRRSAVALVFSRIMRSLFLLPSSIETFHWELRRKKKGWKI